MALGGIGTRLGKALDEQHIGQVTHEIAAHQPLPQGQVHQIRPQVGAEHHEAQIDAHRGGQNHPHGRARRDQRHGGELRAARKHQQAHQQGLEGAEPRLDHGHAGHQAPGGNTRGGVHHLQHAQAKLGVALVLA